MLRLLKKLFRPKPKSPLTPEEKQSIDEQVVIVENITRGE